jgi:hypothetical protein
MTLLSFGIFSLLCIRLHDLPAAACRKRGRHSCPHLPGLLFYYYVISGILNDIRNHFICEADAHRENTSALCVLRMERPAFLIIYRREKCNEEIHQNQ